MLVIIIYFMYGGLSHPLNRKIYKAEVYLVILGHPRNFST
jgi:hypothetical protein